jgi:hypothetical protein
VPQLMAQRERPKSPQGQRVLQLLRHDPNMRRAFIDRVAAPIANKIFGCSNKSQPGCAMSELLAGSLYVRPELTG